MFWIGLGVGLVIGVVVTLGTAFILLGKFFGSGIVND